MLRDERPIRKPKLYPNCNIWDRILIQCADLLAVTKFVIAIHFHPADVSHLMIRRTEFCLPINLNGSHISLNVSSFFSSAFINSIPQINATTFFSLAHPFATTSSNRKKKQTCWRIFIASNVIIKTLSSWNDKKNYCCRPVYKNHSGMWTNCQHMNFFFGWSEVMVIKISMQNKSCFYNWCEMRVYFTVKKAILCVFCCCFFSMDFLSSHQDRWICSRHKTTVENSIEIRTPTN